MVVEVLVVVVGKVSGFTGVVYSYPFGGLVVSNGVVKVVDVVVVKGGLVVVVVVVVLGGNVSGFSGTGML